MKIRGKKLNNKTKCTALTGLCCILAQSLDISSNFWKRRRKKYFSWHWFRGEWINRKIRRQKLLPFLFSVDCSRLESQYCVFNLKYLHSYFQYWENENCYKLKNFTTLTEFVIKPSGENEIICLFTAVNSFCNLFLFIYYRWFLVFVNPTRNIFWLNRGSDKVNGKLEHIRS